MLSHCSNRGRDRRPELVNVGGKIVPVTLRDVAREAGVSTMTVSRVINNKEHISAETRERVLSICSRLGYRPNHFARSLVTQKTGFFGIIVPDISNPFFGDLVRAAESVARSRGFSTLLGDTGGDINVEGNYIEAFRNRLCDAVVLVAPRIGDDLIRSINREVPLVLVDRQIDDLDVVTVALDNRRGAAGAVEHLLSLGHRRIGFIKGPENVPNAHLRYRGWHDALTAVGTDAGNELVFQGEFDRETGAAAFAAFSKLTDPVTAVFASNDLMAYGFVQAARASGLSVPENISVVGFDDIFLSELMYPPLTTVRYPIVEMGTAAIERLLDSVDASDSGREAQDRAPMLQHELIIRGSTAPPR